MLVEFQKYLEKRQLSEETIMSYIWTIKQFLNKYEHINENNLLSYKGYLIEHFKPKTVNLRLQAINKYLTFLGSECLKIRLVRIQHKSFLENVISNADYQYFKTRLKMDGLLEWYFVVWFLAATGARISELMQIKAEHVQIGYLDIYTKGGKVRRLYIPRNLCEDTKKWLKQTGVSSGYFFTNTAGKRLSARNIAQRLKYYAKKYGINHKVVYPHSFRHLFAKNFLAKYSDIALLADLMGHDSIETTRIYLCRTASEQKNIVDKIVTW